MGIGAHFGHKTEPLSPANTVLLDLLSGEKHTKHKQQINLRDPGQKGRIFLLLPQNLVNKMQTFSVFPPAAFSQIATGPVISSISHSHVTTEGQVCKRCRVRTAFSEEQQGKRGFFQ